MSGRRLSREETMQESLAIPAAVRHVVDERDGGFCRMCGKYMGEQRAIHHIFFGGGTGRRRVHDPEEMISLCWMWGGNCHDRAHSNKGLWQRYLMMAIANPGTTAFQHHRRSQRRMTEAAARLVASPIGGDGADLELADAED